jgi:hypothetical protein
MAQTEIMGSKAEAADVLRQRRDKKFIEHGTTDERGIWVPGPYYWATNCTETFDEHWSKKGLASPYSKFPRMEYLHWLFSVMLTSDRLFIAKSREMVVSWSAMALAVWACMVKPRTRVLVQCQKYDKACELVKGTEPPGYARTLYERQEDWLKDAYPLSGKIEDQPADTLSWKNESSIKAVGAGADQVRLYHPSLFIMDEAAHMDEAEQSFSAVLPVCPWIIVVSSTAPGWFASITSRE